MRAACDESAREWRDVVNVAVRGLRVLDFGKEKIFVLTGMIARSRAPNVTLVANHRRPIRNSHAAPCASQAVALPRKEHAKERSDARARPPSARLVRGRAWISGGR
jgi:hypothetical protein